MQLLFRFQSSDGIENVMGRSASLPSGIHHDFLIIPAAGITTHAQSQGADCTE